MKYFVYKHTTPKGMVYIGMTNNIKRRWQPKQYTHGAFKEAIDEFGWENIKHEVIAEFDSKEEAAKFEDWMIEEFKNNGLCLNTNRSGLRTYDEEAYRASKNAETRWERIYYYREYRKIPANTVYNRVAAYRQKHPHCPLTPKHARDNFNKYGIVPVFIKSDDLFRDFIHNDIEPLF